MKISFLSEHKKQDFIISTETLYHQNGYVFKYHLLINSVALKL